MAASFPPPALAVGPAHVHVIVSNDDLGTMLLIETYHTAIEVRITPAGRKITTSTTDRRITMEDPQRGGGV